MRKAKGTRWRRMGDAETVKRSDAARRGWVTRHALRAHEARVSVFCRCGAQWHGRYAVDNPVIADHAARATCRLVTRAEYEQAGWRVVFPAHWTFPVKRVSDVSDVAVSET